MKTPKQIKEEIINNFIKYINKYNKFNLYAGITEQTLKERLSTHEHKEGAIIHTLFNFGKLSTEEEIDILTNKTKSKYYKRIKNAETYAIKLINDLCKLDKNYKSLNIQQIGGGPRHNKDDSHKIYLLLK
ncbi:hypothetical protein crov520 [Cafeteria roenbergensis virus]|uniref:GIY-YIG domain-containing protein n=1 Tax=Cafeteria roenbergensis virus (strain BV-PW1) TaxID=693272 RepID=E3T5U1_CROVB|nr:hypothetical protein crov520 [Cafeteria roenbergensis virus BV-PW1]ADO67554.1 hypothetical protein crov520 [Cafeteria roenbergensis virus BV-PW1]